ncbi:hypothetical protein I3842_05G209900 [Carya illinoinensis]|uniref:Uncharacterized protein n=1 Tax=Carya illinoinensis TaxID=32201 RepID=A0A922F5H4_CARIL|nr:hypothetical protein I3842_05G209900 [Carya illinoinensis]
MNEKQRCVKEKSHLPKAKHVRGRGLEQIWQCLLGHHAYMQRANLFLEPINLRGA